MPTRKRGAKKRLDAGSRKHDAGKWLLSREGPYQDYVSLYVKRYGVSEAVAKDELYALGYHEEVFQEELEAQGIRCEYILNPLTGELVLVPEGTEEHELFI
ncbi:hypothetical protein [Nitrincola sp. MINF-07-Sa-05]|uniref:hypothetical protein n=1 Tax=Nitrincola salilacus TaxID=3400273 RepID=UPI00391832CD